ncbi:MAG TPA: phosphoribosylanthranilate isomerase [Xanthobacteraceae bacterium]|nr:phosphoribosylanthranilate isomerase [Xanthobacteraceae bacterium]
MSVLIKICGLKTAAALDAALAAKADLVGFVFFAPSPRHIAPAAARALGQRVAARAGKVALTVDADDDLLEGIVAALGPDMLQLHGRESPQRVAAVKARFGLPVMKAIPVETRADLAAAEAYAGIADRLLFDARAPRQATRPGGLGTPFDWRLLEDFDRKIPFMLSGGLDAENVETALAVTGAPGVDVSSGVERAPGEKDVERIYAFIAAARRAGGEVPIALSASSSPGLQASRTCPTCDSTESQLGEAELRWRPSHRQTAK